MSFFTRRRTLTTMIALPALLIFATKLPVQAQDAAKPFLHPLFTDHMVFQRGIKAPVWGWTTPGKVVTVSMDGKTAKATAGADGKWMASLGPFKAGGGPYTLTVTGPDTAKVEDILIGDVWICSGQSNMEFGIGNIVNPQAEIDKATNPNIRLFTVPKLIAAEPQTTVASHWETCTPENIKHGVWNGFSAVGYFFGKHLQETEHVPIGLIHTSWGGTIAEAWTSASALRAMPDFVPQIDNVEKIAAAHTPIGNNPNISTVLYNGMIAPLAPFGIKGAIWYQGESNAGRGMQYRTLLPTMIKDWRARFTGGEFPFFIVQLANFTPVVDTPIQEGWADLREAQLLTSENLPKTGIAVALDIGDAGDIHPKNKQEVGRRLGLDADAIAYGKKVEYSGPLYKAMKVEGSKIVLSFTHLGGGLATSDNGPLKGFAIAGADGHFEFADAKIEGDTIVVSSSKVPSPTAVRYAWANNPVCNLVNKAGLPASSFRTDMPLK